MATPTGGGTPTSMPVTTSSVGPVVTSSAAPPGSNAPKGTEKLTVLNLDRFLYEFLYNLPICLDLDNFLENCKT